MHLSLSKPLSVLTKPLIVVLLAAFTVVSCTSPGGQPTPTTVAPPTPTTAPSSTGTQPILTGPITGPLATEAKQLNGAGATFPAPLYSKWFSEYQKIAGVEVNYQPVGSGAGIKSITDNTVDFGGTDGPMTDEQLKAAPGEILHVPTTIGAVVATYNIPGVAKQVRFSPETLSGIFLGEIKRWNDSKLLADNPDAGLPNNDIITVHRSDGSGTTFIFVDYLSSVSEKWKTSVGKGTSVNWPSGLGGKGNAGVAGEIKQTPYSIGYVELAYAVQNKLPVALIKNQAGKFVEPSLASTTAAAAGVADNITPDLRASIVNAKGENAYPIAGFTWLLVYKEQKDQAKAIALTRVLWWAIHEGQKFTSDLDYAPLPDGIVKRAEDKVLAITVSGQPVMKRAQ